MMIPQGMSDLLPDEATFLRLAAEASLVPVYREVVADMETPISAFRKLAATQGACYLLESAEGGERVGRYSFIGCRPLWTAVSRAGVTELRPGPGAPASDIAPTAPRRIPGNPLEVLRGLMQGYRPAPVAGLPRFAGGAVGYCSYDVVRYIERLPGTPLSDRDLPESCFVVTEVVVVFDHLTHRVKIVANAVPGDDAPAAYRRAREAINAVAHALTDEAVPVAAASSGGPATAGAPREDRVVPSQGQFLAAVEQAKEYIRAGDIFQVVLSVRREAPLAAHPFDVYRALRALNPSPYLFYLDLGEAAGIPGGLQLIGSSPELLVRVEDGVVETRPIAGTRPRGRDPEEDAHLEEELLADAKERAEHVMLVDLGRNDVGRVARAGTVAVHDFMTVERYSHVMHIVSGVTGRLRLDRDAIDALAACFPAGTLSGAPKVRAMEIIDELEPVRRGPYGGCIGYFGFSGNMDTCIAIRTIVATGGRAYVQSGAGIVADSVPEREWEECLNKAGALLKALEAAGEKARAAGVGRL